VGWFGGSPVAKQDGGVLVADGRQGRMLLDAFGVRNPNNSGVVEQDGSYPNYAVNGYGRNELVYSCFDAGSAISLADGTVRPIADIRVGDVVRSHKGKDRPVRGVSGRLHTGSLYTICRASASKRVVVTGEHPFFVGRGTRTGDIAYEWVAAADLRTSTRGSNPPDGDWLVEPVPQDLTDLDEFTVTRAARADGKRSNRHWTTWTVPVNDRLLRLVGYFLAEGFCNGRSVKFAFHEDEHDYHDDVGTLMGELFDAHVRDYPILANGRGKVLTFNSNRAVTFFAQFGRGARNKRIPAWVLALPPEKQRHLIDGAWRGDGCASGDRFTLASAGRDLIEGYRLILLRLGVCARLITTTTRPSLPGITGDHILHTLVMTGEQMRLFADRLGLARMGPAPARPRVSAFIRNGYAHWRITEINARLVSDYPVYNLEVEADNSYVADGVAAHNCIRYRAESLPQSVIRVWPAAGNAASLDDHRLRRLFETPNPVTEEHELFELSVTYKDLAGTCFWLVVKGRDGLPSEVWPLMPNLVGVLPNPRNPADFVWMYRPDLNRPEVVVPVENAGSPRAAKADMFIIRIRYPNPNPQDPGWRWFGQPPLRPAARAVTLDNAATDFADSLLRNHAMPSVIVETEAEINDTLSKRLQAKWREAFGGRNRGTPAFLQKGMKIHTLGMTLEQLEFPDLRTFAETRICCVPGTEVVTKRGLVPIESVVVGDVVLTHRGRWRSVRSVLTNPVHDDIHRIDAKGLDPLEVTGNHPVWTARYGQTPTHRQTYEQTEWAAARDLRPKRTDGPFDSLTIPTPTTGSTDATLRLIDHVKGRRFSTYETGELLVHTHPLVHPVPATVPLGAALGRLLGFYMAEGCTGSGKVQWSFHSDEVAYQQLVIDDLKTVFGVDAKVVPVVGENCSTVVCQNAMLAELFACGTARTKRLPVWAWDGSPEFYASLLWGWVAGDGETSTRGWRASTVSKSLAWDMRLVALACGLEPQLRTCRTSLSTIDGRVLNGSPVRYILGVILDQKRRGTYRIDGPHLTTPVRSNYVVDYRGPVYNLEVDEDESYVTTGGTVHNCGAFGVEPILVGTKIGLEHNAYKDYREARLSFWEETMFTEQRRFLAPVRSRLVPLFGGVGRQRIRADWDNSAVLALREAAQAVWDRGVNAFARGGITRNDFRQMVGLPNVAGGDVFLVPAGVTPQQVGEAPPTAQDVSASIDVLAAEFGVYLTDEELVRLGAASIDEDAFPKALPPWVDGPWQP